MSMSIQVPFEIHALNASVIRVTAQKFYRFLVALDTAEVGLQFLNFNDADPSHLEYGKEGWKNRVIKLTALVGYLSKFLDPTVDFSSLIWSEPIGFLLMYAACPENPYINLFSLEQRTCA